MDVFETIEKRRSIRNYEPTPVPREKLEKILEAARLAPSASNVQPRHFIVVTDRERRDTISSGMFARFLKQAPVVIVACGDEKKSPKWYPIDVAIAVENMVLAATGQDLGLLDWQFQRNQSAKCLEDP
jgi:nitroreductase